MEDSILESIYNSTLRLLASHSIQDTYELIVMEALQLVEADSGAVYLEQEHNFSAVYASKDIMYEIKPRKKGNTMQAFSTHSTVIADLSDVGKAHPQLHNLPSPVKSSIFIPLSYQGKAIGVLTLNTQKEAFFDSHKKRVLELFGSMASLAISKTHLLENAKKALETRDLFISMAAHELRTPLTAINGYVQLLQTKITDTSISEGRWIEHLSWECLRLTNLVQELLSVNQIKSGQVPYDFQEKHLGTLLQRIKNDCEFVFPNRNFKFINHIEEKDDLVICDFDKLLQVFTNIVENAVKFSDIESVVSITAADKGKYFSVTIQDKGMGIDQSDLPNIFDKYFKGKKHTREGMGIGLFITKDIIERHKGDIRVQTKLSKGTKVEIRLPKSRL